MHTLSTLKLATIGLRYFNLFGKRQGPAGAYAAVIPKWTVAMIVGEDVFINGDGETSRDPSPMSTARTYSTPGPFRGCCRSHRRSHSLPA